MPCFGCTHKTNIELNQSNETSKDFTLDLPLLFRFLSKTYITIYFKIVIKTRDMQHQDFLNTILLFFLSSISYCRLFHTDKHIFESLKSVLPTGETANLYSFLDNMKKNGKVCVNITPINITFTSRSSMKNKRTSKLPN